MLSVLKQRSRINTIHLVITNFRLKYVHKQRGNFGLRVEAIIPYSNCELFPPFWNTGIDLKHLTELYSFWSESWLNNLGNHHCLRKLEVDVTNYNPLRGFIPTTPTDIIVRKRITTIKTWNHLYTSVYYSLNNLRSTSSFFPSLFLLEGLYLFLWINLRECSCLQVNKIST